MGGDPDQRQGRRLAHRKALGLVSDQAGIGHHVLGQRTLQVRQPSGAAVDLIARCKTGDTCTNGFDGAGKIHTQHGGQIGRQGKRLAHLMDHGIHRIDAGGSHAYQNLAGPGLRFGQIGHFKPGIGAVLIEDHRFHRVSPECVD